jgi:hypothetical protein
LLVFDAKSGERAHVDLPGWFGEDLEAAPGRVYLRASPKSAMYVVDAASHRVAPWPISGGVVTPAYLDADPGGEYLFLAWYHNIAVVDTKTAAVIGRVRTWGTPSIAYDPGARLLVATWDDDPPPTRVMTYRVDSQGLTLVSRLKNPAIGQSGVEPTHNGFIQRGALSLIVWAFKHP